MSFLHLILLGSLPLLIGEVRDSVPKKMSGSAQGWIIEKTFSVLSKKSLDMKSMVCCPGDLLHGDLETVVLWIYI